jgi:hypothetical protein
MSTQTQLSKDSIEISHAKLRLGMTKAEVAEKPPEAQFDQKEGDTWILHNGPVIQFEKGNLTFAAHVWSIENEDIVDALFGVVSYFNEEGDRECWLWLRGTFQRGTDELFPILIPGRRIQN